MTLSRIDHLRPQSSTVWPIQNLRKPSDHAPIFLSLFPLTEKPDLPTIPRWIATHSKCREVLDEVLGPDELHEAPPERLLEIKD
eukprot:4640825-Pyramimonas_sp.AAC.1